MGFFFTAMIIPPFITADMHRLHSHSLCANLLLSRQLGIANMLGATLILRKSSKHTSSALGDDEQKDALSRRKQANQGFLVALIPSPVNLVLDVQFLHAQDCSLCKRLGSPVPH